MRRHRTTARATLVALLLAGLAAAAVTAPASGSQHGAVPRLVFPLVAKTELWDNYGDPRGNGSHAGIDMENPWRAPVVAVEDGRIKYWESSLGGCMLYHYGASGTTYLYIHLNNDLTPRNDNKGGCVKDVAFAVPDGAKVTAGQQIGWNGDSGDASGNPHLHFEVHPNDGGDVNPFRHLKRATKPLFAARKGAVFSLGLRGTLARSRRRRRDAPGRPRPPVPGRPLARHRRARARADGPARRRRRTVARPARRPDATRSQEAGRGLGVHAQGQRDARGDRRRAGRARARSRRADAVDVGPRPLGRTPSDMAGGLSILMPVFNERATVEAAIEDALTAELPVASRELVIVDDGSTDGTRELLADREWPTGVKVVYPRA